MLSHLIQYDTNTYEKSIKSIVFVCPTCIPSLENLLAATKIGCHHRCSLLRKTLIYLALSNSLDYLVNSIIF